MQDAPIAYRLIGPNVFLCYCQHTDSVSNGTPYFTPMKRTILVGRNLLNFFNVIPDIFHDYSFSFKQKSA